MKTLHNTLLISKSKRQKAMLPLQRRKRISMRVMNVANSKVFVVKLKLSHFVLIPSPSDSILSLIHTILGLR